ncbi:hypothetical protein [Asanoa siamensis]|uniref:Uncharacterized protein n=1 Tax=Asanoa siamensis TaxID=926357 RepID=A0ABQ4CHP5_9ACTN|nr:hypothetical protein [Asanoa siamensis]GIF70802.1 hypothetical protein Asi02nite_03200 [Asanoa siamensis]
MSKTVRHILAAALLAVTVGALAAPGPAQAGGWAATVLEPMPAKLTAGQTYTVGMWVLQHGFHPHQGKLDEVALRLTDRSGKETKFAAVPLAEPAHYAVSVVLPHDGPFTVTGIQGWFPAYEVGTISANRGLEQLPTVVALTKEHLAEYWPGAVKPPLLPVDERRDPFAAVVAPPADAPVAEQIVEAQPVASRSSTGVTPWLAGVAAVVLVGSLLVGRRRLVAARRT